MNTLDKILNLLGKKYSLGAETIEGWTVEKFSDRTFVATRTNNIGQVTVSSTIGAGWYQSADIPAPAIPSFVNTAKHYDFTIIYKGSSLLGICQFYSTRVCRILCPGSLILQNVTFKYELTGHLK
jgi:hypothetical protein